MARVTFRPELIAYLLSRKGEVVFLDVMMNNLPAGVNPSSVRSAMRKFVDEGEPIKITVLAAGRAWRIGSMQSAGRTDVPTLDDWGKVKARQAAEHHGSLSPTVGPFVKLGRMEDGSELVRHKDTGQLYTLRAL